MRIVKPSAEIINPLPYTEMLEHIELCGRVCYKSEGRMGYGSAEPFVRNLIKRGHEAVLEHASLTVRFIVDRGVSHEIVRHRLASYCQESTRYCNYGKDDFGGEITVIEPLYLPPGALGRRAWEDACRGAEAAYFDMLGDGYTAQEARAVLPMSVKAEVVMTANIREWRHFLRLRTSRAAHPQMREVAVPLLDTCKGRMPALFEDVGNT